MAVRFPSVPTPAGHYESVYLKAAEPGGRRAVWIRHTVLKRPGLEPRGSVWLTLFDADAAGGAPFTIKVTGGPGEVTGNDGDLMRAAGGAISASRSTAELEADGRRAQWFLAIRGDAEPFPYLPSPRLYRAPLPRTKAVSARPAVTLHGTLMAAGREVDVDGWPGMVGHNWGAEHAERWIWMHGGGLDAILGRVRVGPLLTPWIANGFVELDGTRHRIGGLTRPARVDEAPEGCTFTIRGADLTVEGEVTAPREQLVAWVYSDPSGGEHHSIHTSVADIRLRVGDREVAATGATYELGVRERDHGVPVAPFGDP
jgi:hypothetical protein